MQNYPTAKLCLVGLLDHLTPAHMISQHQEPGLKHVVLSQTLNEDRTRSVLPTCRFPEIIDSLLATYNDFDVAVADTVTNSAQSLVMLNHVHIGQSNRLGSLVVRPSPVGYYRIAKPAMQ